MFYNEYVVKFLYFSPQASKKGIGFKPGGYSLAAGVKGARNISEVSNSFTFSFTFSLISYFHFLFHSQKMMNLNHSNDFCLSARQTSKLKLQYTTI